MNTKTRSTSSPIEGPGRLGPSSARSLLLTLLGEFVRSSRSPTFTAPLLYALAGAGVAEKAARQAIARATAAGWIVGERAGRRTAWRISERGRNLIAEGTTQVLALGTKAEAWNGAWTLLHVTLPDTRRADRVRLYRALSWIGFGNPTPGVWISPDSGRAAQARDTIEELGLTQHTMAFTARTLHFGIPVAQLVQDAWDLGAIVAHYQALIGRFSALRPRGEDGVLFAYVELVNALQRLPSIDPGLPQSLLPPRWDSSRQMTKLLELQLKWRAHAHARWNQLLTQLH